MSRWLSAPQFCSICSFREAFQAGFVFRNCTFFFSPFSPSVESPSSLRRTQWNHHCHCVQPAPSNLMSAWHYNLLTGFHVLACTPISKCKFVSPTLLSMVRNSNTRSKAWLEDAEQSRRYCMICANSIGPSADARRERLCEQSRQRQAQYHERCRDADLAPSTVFQSTSAVRRCTPYRPCICISVILPCLWLYSVPSMYFNFSHRASSVLSLPLPMYFYFSRPKRRFTSTQTRTMSCK